MRERTFAETGNKKPPGLSVAGAFGMIGGLGASAISAGANVAIANKQMRFQERMSNTAHQRQMADLRKAGINPLLSAKLGGATSPPGAAIPVNIDNPVTEGFSARESKRRGDTEAQKTKLTKQQQAAVAVRMELDTATAQSARANARLSDSKSTLNELESTSAGVKEQLWRTPSSALDAIRRGTPWTQGFAPYIPKFGPKPSSNNPAFKNMKFKPPPFKPQRRGAPKGTR